MWRNEPSFLFCARPLRLPPGPRISSRGSVGHSGQFIVHLALEGVHLGHLHLNLIAQLEHAPGAAAHKLTARRVKLIEVVTHAGERHQPAHPQPRNIHKEPEVPHVGDERRIPGRMRGLKLRIQEGEHLHIPAVALGVIRVPLGLGNVLRDFLKRSLRHPLARLLEQGAMHHQVGVAPDGRGEMRVFLLRQPVMAERLDRIARAHERLEESNLQRLADCQPVELLQQLLHLIAVRQIAALNVMAEHLLAIFLKPFVVRRLVNAIERRTIQAHQPGGHGFVGEQHALFDKLVGNVVLHLLHPQHPALIIEADFGFGEVEVQRAGLESRAPDFLGQGIGVMEHALDRVLGTALEQSKHVPVIVTALRADYGRIELRFQDLALGR